MRKLISMLFMTVSVFAQRVTEIPPALSDPVVAGGRVHAIAVHPNDVRVTVIATEFGGLWKTDNGGAHWTHLDGLDEVWVIDVTWTDGGDRLVATVPRGNLRDDNGGIWFSDNRGATWLRASGDLPRPGPRLSAYGLSVAPDDSQRVYAGTDLGVSTSSDGGRSWTRRAGGTASGGPCYAVQALGGNRVIAACSDGVFRRDGVSGAWRRIRSPEGFSTASAQMIDVSPVDPDHVFVMVSYTELLLYLVASEEWISIPLPGGESRAALVKVARGPRGSTEIFTGAGRYLRRIVRNGVAEFRSITAAAWEQTSGAHDDCGDLALGPDERALYFGSDGGLFRSADGGRTWTPTAGRMNSLQISDLAGTNVQLAGGRHQIYLYFTTQDNQNWGSSDGGVTWTRRDGNEGCCLSAPHLVRSAADAQVGYMVFGWSTTRGHPRFAEAGMNNPRHISNTDAGGLGDDLTMLSAPLYVERNVWVRIGSAYGMGPVGIWVSTDNGESWRLRAQVALPYTGGTQTSGRAVLTTFAGTGGRVGILRIDDITAEGVETFDASDLIYPSGNGSLAVRATMFDWHAVFAVDPLNPRHLVAVDVVGNTLTELTDSGWTPLTALTQLVTRNGQSLLFDGLAYRTQVTLLKFDSYQRDRLWVGTRDLGLFLHDSDSDRAVPGTQPIKYITNLFNAPGLVNYVASYGRGLWKITMDDTPRLPPELNLCALHPILCRINLPGDPQRYTLDAAAWRNADVALVIGGRITGIRARGGVVRTLEVTPGARVIRPNAPNVPLSFTVAQRKRSCGLRKAILRNTVVTGVVLREGKLQAFVSGDRMLTQADLPPVRKERESRLLLTSKHSTAGVTIVSAGDSELSFYGVDFEPDGGQIVLSLDGKDAATAEVQPKGETIGVVKLPRLAAGLHWIEARQGERSVRTEFVVVDTETN